MAIDYYELAFARGVGDSLRVPSFYSLMARHRARARARLDCIEPCVGIRVDHRIIIYTSRIRMDY